MFKTCLIELYYCSPNACVFSVQYVSAGNNGREPQGGTTGRDLAAIQVQRAVRGWQARVLAVKMVHDRAWRALVFIQVWMKYTNKQQAGDIFRLLRLDVPSTQRPVAVIFGLEVV